ncbi:hypothetical protein [Martelella mangrovi]|uniref:HNH endonuclease n=1 Tax=Martelella mangrovi TaxID=1397477 RepID=A0ABV2IDL4_9HYPH
MSNSLDFTKKELASRDEWVRAADRARQYLREGDRITYTACPGTKRWGVFVGFDGNWIVTKSRSDVSARGITRVNGRRVDFTDKGVCDVCAHNSMGRWNGSINTHRWSGKACHAIGCPYGYSHALDEGDDIPF